jgi:hypothetical protein
MDSFVSRASAEEAKSKMDGRKGRPAGGEDQSREAEARRSNEEEVEETVKDDNEAEESCANYSPLGSIADE